MRQQIDIHHEQMMEAERLKDELYWMISFISPSDEGKLLVLTHQLNAVIKYGLIAMREADLIADQN